MSEQKNSPLDTVFGWVIGMPIVLALLIVFSPLILYFLGVKAPMVAVRKKSFLRRNAGKQILCISPGRKFQVFYSTYRSEILSLGIDDVTLFDATKPNNEYDGFEWDTMISRVGFPLLVTIEAKGVSQQSLKEEFRWFFRKEIDFIQLKGCIKGKVQKLPDAK